MAGNRSLFNFRNPFINYSAVRVPNGIKSPQQTNNYHYAAFASGNLTASRTIRGFGNGRYGSNTFLLKLYGNK